MKVIIIEDEKAAVRNLKAMLQNVVPQASVLAVTDSITESVEWFSANAMPDVIFMDIHLADGSAFEIFEHTKITAPIIFTTAYDEYALKAFKVNSIDYLLKPISESELKQAMDKLTMLQNTDSLRTPQKLDLFLTSLQQHTQHKTHFLIPSKGDKLTLLPVCDVQFFFVSGGEVRAVVKEGESYLMPHSLEEVSESLNPAEFIRVNRQYIISKKAVKDIDLWFNGRLSVNLHIYTPEKIIISRTKVAEFKSWLTSDAADKF